MHTSSNLIKWSSLHRKCPSGQISAKDIELESHMIYVLSGKG